MRGIKGLGEVAKASGRIDLSRQWETRLPIYFNIKTQTVSAEPGDGFEYVTDLINHCDEKEIYSVIQRWMWM